MVRKILLDMSYIFYYQGKKGWLEELLYNVNIDLIDNLIKSNYSKDLIDEYIEENGFELKTIDNVLDEEALFNQESLDIARYMSKEYIAPLISSFQTMLPPSLKPETKKNVTGILTRLYVELISDDFSLLKGKQLELVEYLNSKESKGEYLKDIPLSGASSVVDALVKKGIVKKEEKEIYRNPFNEIVEKENYKINIFTLW